jgi:hypothetical protein
MTVSTGLSVGIGTTTPTQKLDVFSNSASYSTITARNTVSGFNFAIAGTGDAQVTQTGAYSLQFATNNTEQMRIDANGNMGIGTASPGAKLEVYGTQGGITNPINGSINAVDTTTAALGVGGQIVFKGQYTSGSYTQYGAITAYKESATVDGSQYGAALVFNTRTQGGNNTEKMRIDSSGNLQFNSGYGSVAVAYGCRAWVNFNGTGTVAIRGSGNVSSITDNGTGTYTVNLTSALPDTNGVPTVICNRTSYAQSDAASFGSTSALLVSTAANGLAYDQSIIQVTIVR